MTTNPPGNDSGTPIHDATAAAEGHEIHPGVTVPSYASGAPAARPDDMQRPAGFDDVEPLDAIPADEQLPAGGSYAGVTGPGSSGAASGLGSSGTGALGGDLGAPFGGAPASGDDGSSSGKADAAKGAAADVAGDAKEKAANVAGTAKEQASNVASEVSDHAKQLFGQASSTLKDQAADQQQRAAGGLRTIGEQLGKMAENDDEQGITAKVVRDLSNRAGSVAEYLEGRDPGSLVEEVKSFAARRPGTFIAIAAGAGILAGRLTKALTAEVKHEKEAEARGTTETGPLA
jgi:cell division septum initiation protein DivIVA